MTDVDNASKQRPLTERLRRGFGGLVPPVCDEAANEIERLQSRERTANAHIECVTEHLKRLADAMDMGPSDEGALVDAVIQRLESFELNSP